MSQTSDSDSVHHDTAPLIVSEFRELADRIGNIEFKPLSAGALEPLDEVGAVQYQGIKRQAGLLTERAVKLGYLESVPGMKALLRWRFEGEPHPDPNPIRKYWERGSYELFADLVGLSSQRIVRVVSDDDRTTWKVHPEDQHTILPKAFAELIPPDQYDLQQGCFSRDPHIAKRFQAEHPKERMRRFAAGCNLLATLIQLENAARRSTVPKAASAPDEARQKGRIAHPPVALPIEAKALAVLAHEPGLTKAEIARRIGCSRQHLYKCSMFLSAYNIAEDSARRTLPRGTKDKESGAVEAEDPDSL